MNLGALEPFWLLAQQWRWKHLGDRFTDDNAGLSAGDFLLLVAVAALAVFGVLLLRRYAPPYDRRATYNDPGQLFRELCRSHGLGGTDRRLLKRLAALRGLSHPALVFVMPECFEAATLPPELGDVAQDVTQLRVQLFQAV